MKTNRRIFLKTAVLLGASLAFTVPVLAEEAVQPDDPIPAEYQALWNDEVNAEIDARIEKYRKADAEFTLENAAGCEISVTQKTHDFLFGAHLFNFDQLGSDDLNAKYKSYYGRESLFNAATLPFYWSEMELEEGKVRLHAEYRDSAAYWNQVAEPGKELHWRRPCPEPIIEFCEKNGISMHGHPIIYCPFMPKWLKARVKPEYKEELWKLFKAHIELYISEYGGRLESWDVVNESVNVAPGKERHANMPDDYTFRSWEVAQSGFPKEVKLCINDSWRAVYPPFIKSLIDRGAKIDVVGLQMHIFGSAPMEKIARGEDCITNGTSWKPRDVEAYLRELDLLGRPIHLSEITIPAPGNDARALAIQARVTRDMYRLWFSWPSIYRITWWNVVDDCGYRGEPTVSGLFTRQMEPKPVYYAMDQLINHDWKTTLTLKADGAGKIAFRGFKGEYELSWTGTDGKTYTKRVQVH